MKLDVLGLLGACSYALDCVESELIHVTGHHSKRVAYMSVCTAEKMGISGAALQDLTACALLHDNALTQYIREEMSGDAFDGMTVKPCEDAPQIGLHCIYGEANISAIPFHTDVTGVILYHHENADGSGPFGKTWQEVPLFARIIHLCDLLDAFCRADAFTDEVWNKAEFFLRHACGHAIDAECLDAFSAAFDREHFLSLGDDHLEARLWSLVPRIKYEFDFDEIKAIADFFAGIVDYKSPFTSTHSIGVASTAEKLSRYMGFDEETSQKMYLAGALHDIGKVAVGNEILEKPDRLTADEFAVMKHHAAYTYYILSGVEDFDEIRDWAAFHHERLDGSGYPFGKTADELNTQERIMACADIYQALSEDRPYKKGMSHNDACRIMRDMADKGWLDADIVEQTARCMEPVRQSAQ